MFVKMYHPSIVRAYILRVMKPVPYIHMAGGGKECCDMDSCNANAILGNREKKYFISSQSTWPYLLFHGLIPCEEGPSSPAGLLSITLDSICIEPARH
jgi:hypothetical protein